PQLAITPSDTTPAYGTNTRIYTDFAEPGGGPVVGEQMALLRWDSSAGGWEEIATAPTGADGVATFTVSPTSKATYTVGVDVGSDPTVPLDDAGRTITPHVYLSAPWTSSSTLKRTTTYTCYATLRPEHPAGQKTVLFKTYRLVNGSYRYYKTFYGTNADYLTYTRSSARIRLPYSGKWKVLGWTASDAGHAQTTGPARYVTVK
ncbi:MAG: hypothetical protein HY876_05730, partial [Coriobacteriales bacterium]|nr:hypothetical protein [Coriobacteriales bacterium]